jgi:hypothetical protein
MNMTILFPFAAAATWSKLPSADGCFLCTRKIDRSNLAAHNRDATNRRARSLPAGTHKNGACGDSPSTRRTRRRRGSGSGTTRGWPRRPGWCRSFPPPLRGRGLGRRGTARRRRRRRPRRGGRGRRTRPCAATRRRPRRRGTRRGRARGPARPPPQCPCPGAPRPGSTWLPPPPPLLLLLARPLADTRRTRSCARCRTLDHNYY